MKAIRLKGNLHPELTCLGLKEGDVIRNIQKIVPTGAVHFNVQHTIPVECVVYPDNYEIVE